MRKLTHLSLFSGIGGLDLAAEMAGFQTVGRCEWADYPTKVLEKHWPNVPRWRDIKTLTGGSFYDRTGFRTVDVISGGFPCQPFSVAGKRRGKEDDRYLWPEMLRVVQDLRPTWVIGENVAGIVNMALDTVLSDLESIGYTCQALIIPACATDAAHRRDRCAIISYNNEIRRRVRGSERERVQRDAPLNETDSSCKNVADTNSWTVRNDSDNKREAVGKINPFNNTSCTCRKTDSNTNCNRLEKQRVQGLSEKAGVSATDLCGRATQPKLGGVVDGVPSWMDEYWVKEPDIPRITTNKKNRVSRLKCLGNAVYWRQFYPIFLAIKAIEEGFLEG